MKGKSAETGTFTAEVLVGYIVKSNITVTLSIMQSGELFTDAYVI